MRKGTNHEPDNLKLQTNKQKNNNNKWRIKKKKKKSNKIKKPPEQLCRVNSTEDNGGVRCEGGGVSRIRKFINRRVENNKTNNAQATAQKLFLPQYSEEDTSGRDKIITCLLKVIPS